MPVPQRGWRRRFAVLACLVLLPGMPTPCRAEPPRDEELARLEAWVDASRERWQVPGLALVVVQDGKTLVSRGFGVRRAGRTEPVDRDTVFAIGSATKAFTATALGMLQDEGRLAYDDPAVHHLPGFRVDDAWVSENISIADMLSHRTGIKGCDLLWIWQPGALARDELVRRLAACPRELPFRAAWDYNNLMYLAAGRIIPAVTGRSWDEFVNERILGPLGMADSSTSVRNLEGLQNLASPHVLKDGRPSPIPYRNIDAIAPAGAVNSNIRDMEKWLRLQLDGGLAGKKRLVSQKSLDAMRAVHYAVPAPPLSLDAFPGAHVLGYGLAWFIHDYHGVLVVEHGGNIDGMTALVALIPEREAGLVLLSNMQGTRLREAVMYRVLDLLLGREPVDWNDHFLSIRDRNEAARQEREEMRKKGTSPSLPLAAYAGTYVHPVYGELEIRQQGGGLEMVLMTRASPLSHWHLDTFQRPCSDLEDPGVRLMAFEPGPDGMVAALTDDDMGRFERRNP